MILGLYILDKVKANVKVKVIYIYLYIYIAKQNKKW